MIADYVPARRIDRRGLGTESPSWHWYWRELRMPLRRSLWRGRYYVERNWREARKLKFMRGCRRKVNNSILAKWSAIVDSHHDCPPILQIGHANDRPKR
jgi:hypothetical protein